MMKHSRFKRIAVAAAIATTGLAPAATSEAASASDFRGVWTGVDVLDGSNLVLVISGRQRVVLFDDAATFCAGDPAIATGRGRISGDELRIERFRVNCLGPAPDGVLVYAVEYDAGTGDLIEVEPGTTQTYQRLF